MPTGGPAWWASGGLVLGLWLAGCTTMQDIDRRVERATRELSERLGGGATPPTFREMVRDSYNAPGQARIDPPGENPSPESLEYKPADASRDVLARLDAYAAASASAEKLDLLGVFSTAQKSARDYITAEEEYLLAVIRLLIERHRWSPRFFDDVAAQVNADPATRDYNTALSVINTLRATQRLPYGGEVEAALVTSAAQQLTNIAGDEYLQSSELVLRANVPLLRGAGLVAREDLIQAERDVVYAARTFEQFRREFLVDIASDYFALLAQKATIRNQEERLRSVILFFTQTQALVEAGREPAFQARNIEQNVLTSRNSLINSREAYVLLLDRFKIRLGIPVERAIDLAPMSLDLSDPDISVDEAASIAARYRLDYQNERDRVDDSRRAVANAQNDLLPDLNAAASASLNTDPDSRVAGVSFDAEETEYQASLTLGLPLDREIERLNLRASIIGLEQQSRRADQFRDTVVLEARQSVREIDRSRFSLRLQDQAVKINELRVEELRIKADEVDAQTRLDAENELLQSRNDRDQAVRDLRISILQYLLRTGQLRLTPEGQFQALRGMDLRMIEEPPQEPMPEYRPISDPAQAPEAAPAGDAAPVGDAAPAGDAAPEPAAGEAVPPAP